jgi:hypothetical protein
MSNRAKKEYLAKIRKRYPNATKQEKKIILDEFCSNCSYNRKYAIRLINSKNNSKSVSKTPGRKKRYDDPQIFNFLKKLWISTNLICAKRLKAIIPLWLPYYSGELNQENKELLVQISPASIDRLLSKVRRKYKKSAFATTKPGSLLRKQIPIKTNQWDERKPGFIEADTVAHCGDSIAGQYAHTLNAVDIATGWVEARAIWGKGQSGVFQAINSIVNALPFKIKGFDSDNGGEFINWHLFAYFTKRKRPVQYTRSRAYKKNDNAHIEGKNWTHIRQYLGYHRFDRKEIVSLLNDLYSNEWSPFFNFFIPSAKTVSKERIDSKIVKKFDSPKTPFERLLVSDEIPKKTKRELTRIFNCLNPFKLQKVINSKIKMILSAI